MYRASHILVGTLEEAVKIIDRINTGGDFEELAREHSIDLTSKRGGDVGYFSLGQMIPDFEDACVKLNVGEVSNAVKTQYGYHIIKLTDKKPPTPLEFSVIKPRIKTLLANQKKRQLFDKVVTGMKEKYSITKNLELLKEDSAESAPEISGAE